MFHVGFGNYVNKSKVLAIVYYNSNPVVEMVKNAKKENNIIDATKGKATKTVIVTAEKLILSAITSEALQERFNNAK